MKITREMRFAAGALAFVGAVIWMLPPTQPTGPGGSPGRTVAARPARAAPKTSPEPTLPDAFGPPALQPSSPRPPEAQTAERAPPRPTETAEADEQAAAADTDADANAEEDADRDGRDPEFVRGYRWAEANDVARRRECRRWRGSPAEDGCRAYLRDAEEAEDDPDADPGVAWAPQ